MAKQKLKKSPPKVSRFKLRERMAFARGVKKGLSEGFNEGWEAAHRARDKGDEQLLRTVSAVPPIPEDQLAPEAVERVKEECIASAPVDDAYWESQRDVHRFMKTFSASN